MTDIISVYNSQKERGPTKDLDEVARKLEAMQKVAQDEKVKNALKKEDGRYGRI